MLYDLYLYYIPFFFNFSRFDLLYYLYLLPYLLLLAITASGLVFIALLENKSNKNPGSYIIFSRKDKKFKYFN